jgi:predicted GH43/DUF377 family glycosyl hydrolase
LKKIVTASLLSAILSGLLFLNIGAFVQQKEMENDKSSSMSSHSGVYFNLENTRKIPSKAPFEIIHKENEPVLERGLKGGWDSIDLLNPSVIFKDGIYYNYYSGYDGSTWRTGLATSADGKKWTKSDKNPVLDLSEDKWDNNYIAANGSAIFFNGKVYYYYQGSMEGKSAIGLAISNDGKTFDKEEDPVLIFGGEHTWDENGAADPYVIEHKGYLYMYYLGMDDMNVQKLGVAKSKDGLKWEKLSKNAIMDVGAAGSFDEKGLGEPSVVYYAPYFYMFYTGRDANEKRDIGAAYSLDGVNWKKGNLNGLFNQRKHGEWDEFVICDTTLLIDRVSGNLNVWYGGGNKPSPDQNLNGDVGFFQISLSQNRDVSKMDLEQLSEQHEVDSKDILKGSYDIEGDPGKRTVWVAKESSIPLLNNPSSKQLTIKGYIPFTSHKRANPSLKDVTLSIYIEGQMVNKYSYGEDMVFEIKIDQSKYSEFVQGDYLNLEIKSSTDFTPAKIGSGEDKRELAYLINFIGFE